MASKQTLYIQIEQGIDNFVEMWKDKHNINMIEDITQSKYTALLMFLNRNFIKPNANVFRLPNFAYKLDIIYHLLCIYINMCYEYNKDITILGFCHLTGLDTETIQEWNRHPRQFTYISYDFVGDISNISNSPISRDFGAGLDLDKIFNRNKSNNNSDSDSVSDIYINDKEKSGGGGVVLTFDTSVFWKMLHSNREEWLQGHLLEKGINPVGTIAILNNRFGWATSNSKIEHSGSKELVARDSLLLSDDLEGGNVEPPLLPPNLD